MLCFTKHAFILAGWFNSKLILRRNNKFNSKKNYMDIRNEKKNRKKIQTWFLSFIKVLLILFGIQRPQFAHLECVYHLVAEMLHPSTVFRFAGFRRFRVLTYLFCTILKGECKNAEKLLP